VLSGASGTWQYRLYAPAPRGTAPRLDRTRRPRPHRARGPRRDARRRRQQRQRVAPLPGDRTRCRTRSASADDRLREPRRGRGPRARRALPPARGSRGGLLSAPSPMRSTALHRRHPPSTASASCSTNDRPRSDSGPAERACRGSHVWRHRDAASRSYRPPPTITRSQCPSCGYHTRCRSLTRHTVAGYPLAGDAPSLTCTTSCSSGVMLGAERHLTCSLRSFVPPRASRPGTRHRRALGRPRVGSQGARSRGAASPTVAEQACTRTSACIRLPARTGANGFLQPHRPPLRWRRLQGWPTPAPPRRHGARAPAPRPRPAPRAPPGRQRGPAGLPQRWNRQLQVSLGAAIPGNWSDLLLARTICRLAKSMGKSTKSRWWAGWGWPRVCPVSATRNMEEA
jgi:hypothetical protein